MGKEDRNRGFTLIELIVVIAIIAVLGAILAPQYLRYVEKSRVTKDCSCAAEILEATNVAAMDDAVYKDLPDTGAKVVWESRSKDGRKCSIRCTELSTLEKKVNDTVGETTRSSKALKTATWTVEVKQDPDTKTITSIGKWKGASDGKDDEYTERSGGTV